MDLFTPIVSVEKQHPNFQFFNQTGLLDPEQEVLKKWSEGFIDRDGKFVKEFQTTFNSSFWELYLNAVFRELNCTLDFSNAAPDFYVKSSSGDFLAEATISSNPERFRPEWATDPQTLNNELDVEQHIRLSAIRLTNSITEKYKKYINSYTNLAHVQDKPFLLCVAPFDQPFFYRYDCNAILRVLYSYKGPLTRVDEEGRLEVVRDEEIFQTQKKPGVNLDTGLFLNSEMSEISGVLFNSKATLCKVRALAKNQQYPIRFHSLRYCHDSHEIHSIREYTDFNAEYHESVLDGLHLFINPCAQKPLNPNIFAGREICVHEYDISEKLYSCSIPDGFLLHRTCIAQLPKDQLRGYKDSIIAAQYDELSHQEVWPENQLIYLGGRTQMSSEHHLAHYHGWTLLILLDDTDQDWGCMAKRGFYYNLQDFLRADPEETDYLQGYDFFSSKEEAFALIKNLVDRATEE